MSCFNPRSHEGSDETGTSGIYHVGVSIHAPTKGATDKDRKEVLGYQVSIHAPTKGATLEFDIYWFYCPFQSTLPRRERPQFRPKIHSNFQQKSTNYHFIYLIFPFFHPLFFLHSTSFVHILECESPGIFMCASYSHSYIITKYIICCNSTIGTFFCFIYKSAPFL